MTSAYHQYGVANYSVQGRLIFEGDDVYLLCKNTNYGDNKSIADRLSRNTYSTSAKFYPMRGQASPRRKPLIVDNNPAFKSISKKEADSITERLCKPTFASTVKAEKDPSAPVKEEQYPRSRKQEKEPLTPILKVPASGSRNSSASGTGTGTGTEGGPKFVRFQSGRSSVGQRPGTARSDCINTWFTEMSKIRKKRENKTK